MAERRAPSNGLDFMDLDFDLEAASWPFDPITLFATNPSPSFLNPPSPLWFFEENNNVNGSDTTNGNVNQDHSKTKKPQPPQASEENSDNYCLIIRERMTRALRYFKESTDQHILVQVWAPVKNGNKFVLTTSGQPFVLDPHSLGLHKYRTVSMLYMFSVDGETDKDLGLPGCIFRRKMPEWTPDVQFYGSTEYSRLNHARNYDVRGTLALPVFEPTKQSCVGVVELIMTSRKIYYAPEVEKVSKALEAVNLKSYEILDSPGVQICNEGRQNALAEILEILTTVCETHKLPFAQTWVPCMHRNVLAHGGGSQKSFSSFDGSCMGQVCMSTSDVAVYVIDSNMWGFRDACVEHHLQKGQGVAGRAFESRMKCFSTDITQFCKTEYPLVHYARLFGLSGCLAVCLQSNYTSNDDYILEFFLPPDCKDNSELQNLLDATLGLMKDSFRSLRLSENDDSNGFVHLHANENHKDKMGPEENLVTNAVTDVNEEKNGKMIATSIVKSSGKKGQRKRGKAEKSISLDVLQQYFSGSLKDAAKALGVCPTTMKRICRQHGISRWPSRKINKVNRSLTKLKSVLESVQGAEGTCNLSSLTSQLPITVNLDKLDNDSSPHNKITHQETKQKLYEESSKTSSSIEGSIDTPTSQESCKEVNGNGNNSILDDNIEEPQPNLGVTLLEDSGSCRDLKDLFNRHNKNVILYTNHDRPIVAHEMSAVTIKASYKDDIIRFRLPGGAGMMELNYEVSKRLKLEFGTFDIRYLDDDQEWVMLSCDADLKECIEIAKLSSLHIIRLSVHDVVSFLGSSCGSSK